MANSATSRPSSCADSGVVSSRALRANARIWASRPCCDQNSGVNPTGGSGGIAVPRRLHVRRTASISTTRSHRSTPSEIVDIEEVFDAAVADAERYDGAPVFQRSRFQGR